MVALQIDDKIIPLATKAEVEVKVQAVESYTANLYKTCGVIHKNVEEMKQKMVAKSDVEHLATAKEVAKMRAELAEMREGIEKVLSLLSRKE